MFERMTACGDVAGAGAGVGLAILRRVAQCRGGCARIEEAPGSSCRVLFELPAAGGE